MTEIEQLKKRVEELEAEVARLRAGQPLHVVHSHYHYTPMMQPLSAPQYPPSYPNITYGGVVGSGPVSA